jgi:hypothetical protein
MSQVAASRASSWPPSPAATADYRRAPRAVFRRLPLRTARRRLVKARTKRFCGNGLEYTLSAT